MEEINRLTNEVLKCAFEVHTQLGTGLLKSMYEACLYYELNEHGFFVERQKMLPIHDKEVLLDASYRIDLLIENKLIIEQKSAEQLLPVHQAQVLTYMKLSKIKYGLLLNFNVPSLRYGIKRFVL
ncbi:MAG: GxxExxY protein [Bacteroides sp.]